MEEIIEQLQEATQAFVSTVNNFPIDHFNDRMKENKWSAGEITEHVVKTDQAILQVLQGNTEPSSRPTREKVARIREVFGNHDQGYKAGKFIFPSEAPKDRGALAIQFQSVRQQLMDLSGTLERSVLCKNFEHRAFGFLTPEEWLFFVIFHGDRHLYQILQLEQLIWSKRQGF